MRSIQTISILLLSLFLLLAGSNSTTLAQKGDLPYGSKEITETREVLALTYSERETLGIKFQGTFRLPKATGQAKVQRKKGMTGIDLNLSDMKSATLFGGDYNTYVLWLASPEGLVDNAGEMILRGDQSKISIETPLQTFGMFVTAEPHFLVRSPSRFIVLENISPTHPTASPIQVSKIKYRGFDGTYNYDRETLANMPVTKLEIPTDLLQARTAIKLAERAGADRLASRELNRAREALRRAESAQVSDRRVETGQGREVVRLAIEAQRMAEQEAYQQALVAQRQSNADEKARLNRVVREARSEEERANLSEQHKEQSRIDRSPHQALKQSSDASLFSQSPSIDQEKVRQQIFQSLSPVVETRTTAEGFIAHFSDDMFESNTATLRPKARELLSKVSGILAVAPGYHLTIGGQAQNLSMRRAESVRDYLIQAGLNSSLISTQSLGSPTPSTSTLPSARKNNAVEIIFENIQASKS